MIQQSCLRLMVRILKKKKINKLKEIIIDAGISKQPELHNAVVDTLITNLNYLNQLRELGLEVPEKL